MRKHLLLLVGLAASAIVYAQQVSGSIKDENGKSISGVTISLLQAKDSATVKLATTKEDGSFTIPAKGGHYLINATYIGHAPSYSAAFTVAESNVSVPAITLTKRAAALQGVTVTSKKPMVEVKADKTILNVEGTINAVGSDALELLRKAPGVVVDNDDNLSLSGKNGVQVFIDGRPSPLSGRDLSDYLKSLPSAQIEAIETITNPSAKFEAAGNAGIINIRLKKNKSFGTNGSVNAGWNIGTFPKYNAGLSLNHRNQSVNLFGTYSYNRGRNANYMDIYRINNDTLFDNTTKMGTHYNNHNYKVGMDYFISKKSTLGLIANGTVAENDYQGRSTTPITYVPTNILDRTLRASSSNLSKRNNTNINLNYRFVDTSGKELNIDADHGRYRINSDQMQGNFYFNPSNNELYRAIYNMLSPSEIDIYSFKTDYEQSFKKGKLGIGGKFANINTDNDFQRYDVYTNGKELDKERSNRFDYKENINAGYINYNRTIKHLVLQAGVRVENTTSKGHSSGLKYNGGAYKQYDSSFERSYTDVFPSAALTFTKNPKSQFGLTYSRRIDRPAYQDLNPFEFKIDDYTFMKGNIDLRPQYTNSFGLTHTYKYKLTTKLNYSHVKDMFAQLIDTINKSANFMTKKNLATQDIISLNISYPYQYKAYSLFANLSSNYSRYQANYGKGREIDQDVFTYNMYVQNSIRFAKTWTAEVSGWFNSPNIWGGTMKSIAMGSVDAGLQKQVFKGKANVKAAVTDIFQTLKWGGNSDFAGQQFKMRGGFESRQFKLNFSYRFGNSQVKAARQRKSGAEEESSRTQSSGGIGQ